MGVGGVVHGDEVAGLGEFSAGDVGREFFEGGDALLLEALVFGVEISVGFGVAGDAFVVVAEDVVGEKKLGVAAGAGAEGHEEEGGVFAEVSGELVGDEFEFGGVGAGGFEAFHLVVKAAGFGGGFADGADIGPGGVARDHAEVADDRDAFAGHGFDDKGAGAAIDRAGAEFERFKADADGFFLGGEAVRGGAGEKTFRRSFYEGGEAGLRGGRIEAAAHEVDASGFGGGGFLGGFDVDVRELAFAFELAEIVDGIFFGGAEHAAILRAVVHGHNLF